jgi:hypothetical protein
LTFNCSKEKSPFAEGTLEIFFTLNKPAGELEPSYQTAIWLEDITGNYTKSLLVSEYLSYGGYNNATICPAWRTEADWDNVSDEEFDAVTQATPDAAPNILKIDCKEHRILPGLYKYFVQTHIQEKYNILYFGYIEMGVKSNENTAVAKYYPVKQPIAGNVLSEVRAKYYH